MTDRLHQYSQDGFCLIKDVITLPVVNKLLAALMPLEHSQSAHGVRNLLSKVDEIKQFVQSSTIRNLIEPFIGKQATPVRAIFFDKIPNANWNVAWHQDTTIAVDRRVDIDGFGPWSTKDGVIHVEPPEYILKNLLTLRLHLDATDSDNGALRVIPGSHQKGRLRSNEILTLVESSQIMECLASPGDVLLMNPLLVHSSRKSRNPSHRRIIHVEFSSSLLPAPLDWHEKHPLQ